MKPSIKLIYSLTLLIIFIPACEDNQPPAPTQTGEDIIPDEEITLANCSEDINENVPAFFQKYFKCVDVDVDNNWIVISTDGSPPHQSWYYPSGHPNYIDFESQGEGYYQNPNEIQPQDIVMSIPVNPTPRGIQITETGVDGEVGTDPNEFGMGARGTSLDGVALFNPLAAPGDDIEDEKYSFDYYNGHPEMTGMYHYHTTTKGPLEVLEHEGLIQTPTPGSGEIEVYGIMCDGTVILGCTELDSSSPTASELDAQNGHVHDMVDENGTTHFTNRYHTHICTEQFTNHKFTPELMYYDRCEMVAMELQELKIVD